MTAKQGFCTCKPRKLAYLYVNNVDDNIEDIKNFLKTYSNGLEYKYKILNGVLSNFYVYSFYVDGENWVTIENTSRYIIFDFDRDWLEFDVYSEEEFEKLFNQVKKVLKWKTK